MTCIVGLLDKENDIVIMGADSAGVGSNFIDIRKDPKIFKVGNFIIGCTSSFRMIQLLRFELKPPHTQDKDIYEYMCTDFIDAVKNCFTDGGYIQRYKSGDDKGGTFLVGYKNRLFTIHNDFQVAESDYNFASIGCGEEYALGSLQTLEGIHASPEEKVLTALKVAEVFSSGVRGPFNIITTANDTK